MSYYVVYQPILTVHTYTKFKATEAFPTDISVVANVLQWDY